MSDLPPEMLDSADAGRGGRDRRGAAPHHRSHARGRPRRHPVGGPDRSRRTRRTRSSPWATRSPMASRAVRCSTRRCRWPAQVAGGPRHDDFAVPRYGGPLDGLPLNIETVARRLQDRFGKGMSCWRRCATPKELQDIFDENEDYWERARARAARDRRALRQPRDLRLGRPRRPVVHRSPGGGPRRRPRRRQLVGVKPDHDNDIAASSVLAPFGADATQLTAGSGTGDNGGIDTLVVALGANNALDPVVSKRVRWSGDGFDRLDANGPPTTCGSRRTSPEYAARRRRS